MIMRDLPWWKLQELQSGEYTSWENYRMKYIPRKLFWLKNEETNQSRTIYDVFGFFQMKFVKALGDWKVATPEEIDPIEQMKEQRGYFKLENLEEITKYCLEECLYLANIGHKLFYALNEAKLYPSKYSGAGSIAGYLMAYHKIKGFIERDEFVEKMALNGYFGGRFDLSGSGNFKGCWSYDINSAYPAECLRLPCLIHGSWKATYDYQPTEKYALWEIAWKVPLSSKWTPFPWRDKKGSIYYTSVGQGWYWQDEIREGIKLIETLGGECIIKAGMVWDQECDHQPFSWLPEFYELRREYQRNGNAAEKVMKLGYNSLYGKVAQTVGWKTGNEIQRPPFQSWVWAGLITSGTRAKVLSITTSNLDSIISHATDGVISTKRLNFPDIGSELGQWKEQEEGELWLIQPGIYWFPNPPGSKPETDRPGEIKLRGHNFREVDWNKLTKNWLADPFGGTYQYTAHRFIGMGTALWRNDFSKVWRTWQDIEMKIYFKPRRKMDIPDKKYLREHRQVRWVSRPDLGGVPSRPYHHKEIWDQQYQQIRFEKLLRLEQPG